MTSSFKYGAIGSVIHAMTNSEIGASLATLTLSGLSSEYDNTTNAYIECLVNLQLGSAAFVAGNVFSLFCLPSRDLAGAAYPTLRTYAQETLYNYKIADIGIPGTTAAQEVNFWPVIIPPGKMKFFCATSGTSCPALAASGNLVDLYPYYKSVA